VRAWPVNVVIRDTENGGNFRTPLEAGNRSPAGGAVRLSADVGEVLAHEKVAVPPYAGPLLGLLTQTFVIVDGTLHTPVVVDTNPSNVYGTSPPYVGKNFI
jgi:hypothetical protein